MSRSQRQKSERRSVQSSIVEWCKSNPINLSNKEVESLLYTLCVKLGYCLSPGAQEKVLSNPPTDPETFACLIMELEGVGSGDTKMYQPVFECIHSVFCEISRANES